MAKAKIFFQNPKFSKKNSIGKQSKKKKLTGSGFRKEKTTNKLNCISILSTLSIKQKINSFIFVLDHLFIFINIDCNSQIQ